MQVETNNIVAPSKEPSTQIITSLITPSAIAPGETPAPSIIVITSSVSHESGTKSATNSQTLAKPPESATTSTAETTQSSHAVSTSSNPSTGAIAGAAVGAILSVLIIAAVAFSLGLRCRRKRQWYPGEQGNVHGGAFGYKPELDSHEIQHRWGSKWRAGAKIKALNETPQELEASLVRRPEMAHQPSSAIGDTRGSAFEHNSDLVEMDISARNVDSSSSPRVETDRRMHTPKPNRTYSAFDDPRLTQNPWSQDT